jgi:tryptophan halogenase
VSEGVQSVVVVGRDAPAWLAAAALRRSFGRSGLRVQVVELPPQRTPVDAYAAVPSLASMHQLLGLEEHVVLGACRGLPMVAQRFSNWARGGSPFFIAYDDEPPSGGDLPFVQYWAKGALEGLRVAFDEFSLGSACARVGRVPVTTDAKERLSASYGYHLDALAYSELLKQFALRLGVEAAPVGLTHVDIEDDRVTGLDLADGTRLTADLYVDASGAEARLIGKLEGGELESWAQWLPCDRLLAATAPALPTLPVFSQVSAFRGGWVGLFPLRHRTAVVACYNSRAAGDQDVAEQVGVIARMPIGGDAVVGRIRPGARRRSWIGNCVAIGEAAIACDPIDALDLHVAQGCISHLITLFPATAAESTEADEYNRAMHLFGSNLRDFQAAHYKLNRRFDDPFWDAARDAAVPDSLQRRLDAFEARALIVLNDEESFQESGWASLLLGCGLLPTGYDPRIDAVPDEQHIQKVQQRLRDVARVAQQMPKIDDLLLDRAAPAQLSG